MDETPAKDLDTPFKDRHGREHPGWHRADVVLADRLWTRDPGGLPAGAAGRLRAALAGDRGAAGGMVVGLITSPDGALGVSPGLSGRVFVGEGFVSVDFRSDWGTVSGFLGDRLSAVPDDAKAEVLADLYPWMNADGPEGLRRLERGARGVAVVGRLDTADFAEAMAWIAERDEELRARDGDRREELDARFAEALDAAGLGPVGPSL